MTVISHIITITYHLQNVLVKIVVITVEGHCLPDVIAWMTVSFGRV